MRQKTKSDGAVLTTEATDPAAPTVAKKLHSNYKAAELHVTVLKCKLGATPMHAGRAGGTGRLKCAGHSAHVHEQLRYALR